VAQVVEHLPKNKQKYKTEKNYPQVQEQVKWFNENIKN
jgi:hypothetical protein